MRVSYPGVACFTIRGICDKKFKFKNQTRLRATVASGPPGSMAHGANYFFLVKKVYECGGRGEHNFTKTHYLTIKTTSTSYFKMF